MNTESEAAPPYRPHVGPARQYIRDIILGVNDGLVSIFLLVVGVVGAGFDTRAIVLSGVAAAVAGAASMATGEYIATKSQEEVFDREQALEIEHLKYHRDVERDEIREMFGDMGLGAEHIERIVEALDADDEVFLRVMMALEFGVVEEERRSPATAAFFSGVLFLAGSLPSLLPFFFVDSSGLGLVIAAIAAGISLFTVGAVKTLATGKNPVASGLENVAFGGVGAAVSFAVGNLFEGIA